jgi:glycosyltransferase involved in cell wall biosynthesis
MIKGKTVSLCMPVRNEEGHIRQLLESIPSEVDEIVIVDNRSIDTSKAEALLAKDDRIKVYSDDRVDGHGIGYGYAIDTAVKKATSQIIVCMDLDGTYPVDSIRPAVEEYLNGGLDFMNCSRYLRRNKQLPLVSRLGAFIFSNIIHLRFNTKISDPLSGMWVFRKSVFKKLNTQETGWNFSLEIKLNAFLNSNIICDEYDITPNIRYGKTKQKYMKTFLNSWSYISKF